MNQSFSFVTGTYPNYTINTVNSGKTIKFYVNGKTHHENLIKLTSEYRNNNNSYCEFDNGKRSINIENNTLSLTKKGGVSVFDISDNSFYDSLEYIACSELLQKDKKLLTTLNKMVKKFEIRDEEYDTTLIVFSGTLGICMFILLCYLYLPLYYHI